MDKFEKIMILSLLGTIIAIFIYLIGVQMGKVIGLNQNKETENVLYERIFELKSKNGLLNKRCTKVLKINPDKIYRKEN